MEEGRSLIQRILFTPSIYFVLEEHISWQDVIALMRTCKALYHNWLSADAQRWKRARVFKDLRDVLGMGTLYKLNNIKQTRLRAVWSTNKSPSSFTTPCMGGCGTSARLSRAICESLPYMICCSCAVSESKWGFRVVNRYLNRHGLIRGKPCVYTLSEWCIKQVGEKIWHEHKNVLINTWIGFYINHVELETGWKMEVCRASHVEDLVDKLLRQCNLLQ